MNLGVLAYFKYANFGLENARAALSALGFVVPTFALSITLPVGISFFTFESMSYVIDVYRGEIKPHQSYLEYLTFVAFFPHLVAGPIVRPRELLPQLAAAPRWDDQEASAALLMIAIGLLKKLAIADYLGLNLVDRVFDAPTQYSALECYVAVVGYAADFTPIFLAIRTSLISAQQHLGCAISRELRRSLSGARHRGVLEAVAYLAVRGCATTVTSCWVAIVAPTAHVCQSDRHDAAGWLVARTEVDIRDLGRFARGRAGPEPRFSRALRGPPGQHASPAHRRDGVHFSLRAAGLGVLFR